MEKIKLFEGKVGRSQYEEQPGPSEQLDFRNACVKMISTWRNV